MERGVSQRGDRGRLASLKPFTRKYPNNVPRNRGLEHARFTCECNKQEINDDDDAEWR